MHLSHLPFRTKHHLPQSDDFPLLPVFMTRSCKFVIFHDFGRGFLPGIFHFILYFSSPRMKIVAFRESVSSEASPVATRCFCIFTSFDEPEVVEIFNLLDFRSVFFRGFYTIISVPAWIFRCIPYSRRCSVKFPLWFSATLRRITTVQDYAPRETSDMMEKAGYVCGYLQLQPPHH